MFRIDLNWEDGSDVKGPELSATWCSMSISVNGLLVTDVLRSRSKSVDDKIYVPAYVLAEWFVLNWFSLLEELESPRRRLDNEYTKRHGLLFSKNGYEFPNIYIHKVGDGIKVECLKVQSPLYGLRYLSEGSELVSSSSFEKTVYHFINTVTARLDDTGVEGTLLQEEWDHICHMHQEEASFCRAAGAIGQNPFEMDASGAERLVALHADTERSLIHELSGISTSLNELEEIVNRINTATNSSNFDFQFPLSNFERVTGHTEEISESSSSRLNSWTLGYSTATDFRRQLGIDSTYVFGDVSTFIRMLSGKQTYASSPLYNFRALNGLSRARGDGSGILDVAVNRHREQSVLFDLGRALGLHLAFPTTQVLPITSSPSYPQQTSRAFAAELLAPADAIRERIRSAEYLDDSDWDEIAQGFGVSPWVIHHQVQNHQLYRHP